MKFKIDENLPVEISEMLTNAGHDVVIKNMWYFIKLKYKYLFYSFKNRHVFLIH
jgi:hypothetical protein